MAGANNNNVANIVAVDICFFGPQFDCVVFAGRYVRDRSWADGVYTVIDGDVPAEDESARVVHDGHGSIAGMAHSSHKQWKGCMLCKPHKHRGHGQAERDPWAVRRKLGVKRRYKRNDLGE